MVICAVSVHPAALVPVTVYVVVAPGVTLTEEPDKFPGCQLYVFAPDELNVVLAPVQIVCCEVVAVTVGVGFTVITCVAVELPLPFVAVS